MDFLLVGIAVACLMSGFFETPDWWVGAGFSETDSFCVDGDLVDAGVAGFFLAVFFLAAILVGGLEIVDV